MLHSSFCFRNVDIIPHFRNESQGATKIVFLSCQSRADFGGVGICPLKRERPALVGFNGIDAAEVVVHQVGAGAVRTAFEDEAPPVGRDLRFALDERRFAHSEERRDACNLRVRDAHDPVLDAATRPAHPAREIIRFHFFASFAFFAAKPLGESVLRFKSQPKRTHHRLSPAHYPMTPLLSASSAFRRRRS